MMRFLALLCAALVGAVVAQTSVVTLALPSLIETATIHASVVTTVGDATSYHLACPSGANIDCGVMPNFNLLEGPNTVSFNFGDNAGNIINSDCTVTGEIAHCVWTDVSEGTTSTDSDDYTTTAWPMSAVTITAGLEKLCTTTGEVTTTSAPTNSTSVTTSSTGSLFLTTITDVVVSTSSTTDIASTSSTTIATSTTSNGGVPGITQQAILAGAAVVAGGAMLL